MGLESRSWEIYIGCLYGVPFSLSLAVSMGYPRGTLNDGPIKSEMAHVVNYAIVRQLRVHKVADGSLAEH